MISHSLRIAWMEPNDGHPNVRHVYPIDCGHVVSGEAGGHGECWCNPRITRLCGQCDGSDEGCWACHEGLVDVESIEPGDRAIVIHRHVYQDVSPIEV